MRSAWDEFVDGVLHVFVIVMMFAMMLGLFFGPGIALVACGHPVWGTIALTVATFVLGVALVHGINKAREFNER